MDDKKAKSLGFIIRGVHVIELRGENGRVAVDNSCVEGRNAGVQGLAGVRGVDIPLGGLGRRQLFNKNEKLKEN